MSTAPTTQDDHVATESSTDLRTMFPALHLLRASGLAIDPRKMLLGGIGLILLAAGNWLFEYLPFAPDDSSIIYGKFPESSVFRRALGCAGFTTRPMITSWYSWEATAVTLLTPIRTLVEPCRVLFQTDNSWSSLAYAWTQLLWALIVWSFIGGALCRMNALQFAVRKRIGFLEAYRFSRRQLSGYLVAPLLPFSAVLILQGFNWVLGMVASLLPSIGDVVLGIGWCVVLFCGFLMTMLVLGIAAGWPMMVAAISTEDSDGFDGLSRAFGYLFDRPWHAAMFALSSLPIFAASRLLVAILIGLTTSLGAVAVGQGENSSSMHWDFSYVLRADISHRTHLIPIGPAGIDASKLESTLTGNHQLRWPDSLSGKLTFGWTCIPALLYVGFGPSFFWSATTVSYFLLRKSDDGTPLDSVVDWEAESKSETSDDRTDETESVSLEEENSVHPDTSQ